MIDLFGIKKKVEAAKLKKQLALDVKITSALEKDFSNISDNETEYKLNPFIDTVNQKGDKVYVEDIEVYDPSLCDNFLPLYHVLRDPYINHKDRKKFARDLVEKWEYDYYKTIDKDLKKTLDQTTFIPVKRIVKISNFKINCYIMLALLFMILLKQYSLFQTVKYIGNFFIYVNTVLIYPIYHNIAVGVFYLSILISMYLIIVKVYFEKVLKYGLSAKGFMIKERDRMLKKFRPHVKKLRRHLVKIVKSFKLDVKYELNSIYNSKTVVRRIQKYGRSVINRVGIFTSYYSMIITISKLLRLVLIGLIIYLIYSLIVVNNLISL